MDSEKLYRQYLPMSETAYYILLSLTETRHGYGIIQFVQELTHGRIHLGPGTIYGSLSRMEKDRLIQAVAEEERRKLYCITPSGKELLKLEIARITELYENAKKVEGSFDE
ncbi:PadR family transcriptional regulator [Paenibacillus qinlingensis]|uniref:DNA-binding PadR family transcriptional regulator n=1 Tax=Paenibacillus qinlingensis TaxID=1837343 RepID=A0ABU1P3Y0_9BACL|nr:PadR family transcriptional regulator [Paenibacillus qinlingensis]MDR6554279.1 DNA-binding PadR family transcriptional regulator [Paenibacillus qinlingensis]